MKGIFFIIEEVMPPQGEIVPNQSGSTVRVCTETSCGDIAVSMSGVLHQSYLTCSNKIYYYNVPSGTHTFAAVCIIGDNYGTWSNSFYVDGSTTYFIYLCPTGLAPCCLTGCGIGDVYNCSTCLTPPTTTTSTISVTTSINPTTTTVGSGCLPGEIDCGNGYCCPPDYPICGYGQDTGYCFSEGGGCLLETIYGEQSAETKLLRSLRDNILNQTSEGQELIRLYYQWSPALVKAMEGDEGFKKEVKEVIEGILPMIRGEVK